MSRRDLWTELDELDDGQLSQRVDDRLDDELWQAGAAQELPPELRHRVSTTVSARDSAQDLAPVSAPASSPEAPPVGGRPATGNRQRARAGPVRRALAIAALLLSALGLGFFVGRLDTGGPSPPAPEVIWRGAPGDPVELELRLDASGTVLTWTGDADVAGYRLELIDRRGRPLQVIELAPAVRQFRLESDGDGAQAAYVRLTAVLQDGGLLSSDILELRPAMNRGP